MKFLLVLIVSVFALVPLHSFAQARRTIVVSDIDDTIQLTQIKTGGPGLVVQARYYWNFVSGLFKNHDAFVGMPALYMALATNGREVQYVSGAPSLISYLPEKFLQTTGFPHGQLSLRPSLKVSTEEFKVQRISEIMASNPDARFILVGDNGERDVAVYDRLKNDQQLGPRIEAVYIHRLYREGELAAGQLPYLTAADLAVQLQRSGDLETRQVAQILKLVDEGLKSRFAQIQNRTFPNFATLQPSDIEILSQFGLEIVEPELSSTFDSITSSLARRVPAKKLD